MAELPTGASDTFVHPCLTCGKTVQVVAGTEQPHECQTFDPEQGESLAAFAWWQGYEYAKNQQILNDRLAKSIKAVEDAITRLPRQERTERRAAR